MSKVVNGFGQLSVLIETPENQNLSYRSKFQWLLDQGKGNFARVGRESELSMFELTKGKWLESGVKSKGNWTYFGLVGSLSYPSLSCQGSTVSIPYHRWLPYFNPLAFGISKMRYPPCLLNPIIVKPPPKPSHSDFPFFSFFWELLAGFANTPTLAYFTPKYFKWLYFCTSVQLVTEEIIMIPGNSGMKILKK